MIPAPKLDDRNYADIVNEAIRLIPRYCPEWTNHNPSDPGITILELCAWMTELILYRLNRVPEKNYIAFLNMMGIQLRTPQPAHGLITFQLVEGAERQTIPEGTQIATPQSADEDTVLFETQRDLIVVGAPLDRCFSYYSDTYADNSPFLAGSRPEGFEAFGGADRIDRYLYLGDPRFESLSDASVLRLHLTAPEHGGRDIARLLEWEYWNGRRWRELRTVTMEVERGEVVFYGPQDMAKTTVHGIDNYWVRGRLAEVPMNPWETELNTTKAVIEVVGEGVLPDVALANLDGGVFLPLDLGKNSHPLGTHPKIDQCLYLASREILSQPEAEVRLEVVLSDPAIIPAARGSEDLVLSWEYFDGKRWRILGKSGPTGRRGGEASEWSFIDGTNAFTKTGVITFRVPRDMQPGEVNGEANYWMRARIETGDYGSPGNYMLDGDKWVWRDDRPLHPPGFKSIAFKYRADLQHAKHVLSYNDFRFRDHTEESKIEYRTFQPFSAVADEGAALYLGWNGKLPNDPISLYFLLTDAPVRDEDRNNAEFLKGWYAERDAMWESEQRVSWEYYDGTAWQPLVVIDGTKNFTQSGFLDFVGPDDHQRSLKFTEDRYWVRGRLEMGGYVRPPRIQRVLMNTVEAANSVTIRDEIIGSSDATPLQSFPCTQGPLLEGEILEVREKDMPPNEEIDDLGDEAVRPADAGEGYWVRWKPVESLFDSGPRARHYTRNPINGRFTFGDGVRGMIPPQLRNNIVLRKYQVGGGTRGNVNAKTLTQMTRAIAYVEKCFNAVPAAGGADAETVEEAKERAPLTLKSRDRAVTAEDFEALARKASTSVARAKCLPSQQHNGEVQVVIVPRGDDKNMDLTKRLVPPPELLRYVKNYLDERRLVGTVLEVIKPGYVEISLKVTLVRRTVGQTERVKREIEERLRTYLHPLKGGRDSKGWPFGRAVYKTDLAHLIEDIPGVEAIDSIIIFDEDKRVAVENVRVEPPELVHLVNVAVVERVREEIGLISQQRALVRMPDVVGMPYVKAKLILENAGLTIDGLVFQESYEMRDVVLNQKPGRGQMVYTGEKVILGVSRESYIKWLPSMYQRPDINGRNFIRDLLWITQHMFGSIDETLDQVHQFFDPYEAPEKFLPWLASWSAMVLDEDWPLPKKRRLIRKAIELYRVRGTVKGMKLFLGMFTGAEPIVRENEWPFKGWRIGVTSGIGVDTVVLPPVNLSHAFIIEMPVSYKDISTETMVRIHEIIQMEKPANCQYYLKFAVDDGGGPLKEFFTVGEGGIGVGAVDIDAITSEEELNKILAGEAPKPAQADNRTMALPAMGMQGQKGAPPPEDEFTSRPRSKPPLKAPRADTAPIEGQDGRRTMMAQAVEYSAPTEQLSARKTEARTVIRETPKEVTEKKTVMKDVRNIESDKTMTIDSVKDDGPKKKR